MKFKLVYKDEECSYPGGMVYCKQRGLKDNIVSWDFKGYYSSLMRTFNIGPDTIMLPEDLMNVDEKKRPYIPLIKSPYTHLNEEVIDKFKEKLYDAGLNIKKVEENISGYNLKIDVINYELNLPKEKVRDFYIYSQKIIDELWGTYNGKLTITKEAFHGFLFRFKNSRVVNGRVTVTIGMPYQCYFRQDFDSIIRIALNVADKERAVWKKIKKDLEERGLKNSIEWRRAESEQLAYKLLGNIMYGQMGTIWARIYHPACAMSITLAGQFSTQWTRKYFHRNGKIVWYMDTDSNYVYDKNYSIENEIKFIKHFNETYHQGLHKYLYDTFKVKLVDNCIFLEKEKVWKRMMFLSKKHYAGVVVESDGVNCNVLVTRGIELRRTGTIKFSKRFQEEYYEMIFRDELPDSKVFIDLVERYRDEFYSMDFNTKENIEQITKRMKLNMKIEDYKVDTCQVNLMNRCVEDGETLEIGSMLEYVLLKIQVKQTKNHAETVERFIKSDGHMKIHRDKYWDKEIYNPIYKQLIRIFPEVDWGSYDTEHKRICSDKFKSCKKALTKKRVKEQWKLVNIIINYSRFSKAQALELLNNCKDRFICDIDNDSKSKKYLTFKKTLDSDYDAPKLIHDISRTKVISKTEALELLDLIVVEDDAKLNKVKEQWLNEKTSVEYMAEMKSMIINGIDFWESGDYLSEGEDEDVTF